MPNNDEKQLGHERLRVYTITAFPLLKLFISLLSLYIAHLPLTTLDESFWCFDSSFECCVVFVFVLLCIKNLHEITSTIHLEFHKLFLKTFSLWYTEKFKKYSWNFRCIKIKWCIIHKGFVTYVLWPLQWIHQYPKNILKNTVKIPGYHKNKAMKSSPLLGPFCGSEFWRFSLLKI